MKSHLVEREEAILSGAKNMNGVKFPKKIRQALERFPMICSDPNIMSGAPCVRGRRVPAYMLAGRYAAGESFSHIAEDYEMSEDDVRNAIRFTCWLSEIGNIKWWKFYEAE